MTTIRCASALLALALLLAPARLSAEDEAESPRVRAITAVARVQSRVAQFAKLDQELEQAVAEAKQALEAARNAPARARSETARRENARAVAAADWALRLAQARAKAGGVMDAQAAEEAAVLEALLEAEEYAAVETKAERTVELLGHLHAARQNRLDSVSEAYALDPRGRTRLHIAAMKSDGAAAARALSVGLPVDRTDKDGFTPLHLAAWFGAEAVAQKLLEAGADVSLTAPQSPLSADPLGASKADDCPLSGPTALHLACYTGRGAIVELLLGRDADPSTVLGFKDVGAG